MIEGFDKNALVIVNLIMTYAYFSFVPDAIR